MLLAGGRAMQVVTIISIIAIKFDQHIVEKVNFIIGSTSLNFARQSHCGYAFKPFKQHYRLCVEYEITLMCTTD